MSQFRESKADETIAEAYITRRPSTQDTILRVDCAASNNEIDFERSSKNLKMGALKASRTSGGERDELRLGKNTPRHF